MRTTLRCVGALASAVLCVAVVGACGGDDDSAQSLPAADNGDGDGDDSDGDDSDGDDSDGDDNDGDDNDGDDNGGDNGGAPGGGSGGGAPGAPIKIPAITELSFRTVNDATEEMKRKIREACGGNLCLVVEVEVEGEEGPGDQGDTNCFYSGRPPEGTPVDRGSTFVLEAFCGPPGPDTGPDTDTETDGEGGPDTGTDPDTVPDGEGGPDTGTDPDTETDTGGEAETQSTP